MVAPTYEGEIRKASETDPIAASVHWIFPQSPFWRLADGERPKAERRHNLLWQIAALKEARKLARDVQFDAVHQVARGGLRFPSLLWKLPAPVVLGPAGDGGTSPAELRDAVGLKSRLTEWVGQEAGDTSRGPQVSDSPRSMAQTLSDVVSLNESAFPRF
jgi:hypothetical protein